MHNLILSPFSKEDLIEDTAQRVVDKILQKLPYLLNEDENEDKWLDLPDLVEYDPEKRSKPTFYGYVASNSIPYHKNGKKLIFLKSEIDEWLKKGRRKTTAEALAEAQELLSK